jgi:hypothetical protein
MYSTRVMIFKQKLITKVLIIHALRYTPFSHVQRENGDLQMLCNKAADPDW